VHVLLALAIAVGSWIVVPGGSWQPQASDIAEAKSQLRAYVSTQARLEKRTLAPWNRYTFQIQGRDVNGRKVIYVNAFCSAPSDNADERIVLAFDGGTCYFQAYFDVETKAFAGMKFNGLA